MKTLLPIVLFLLTLAPLTSFVRPAHAQNTAMVAVDPGNISDFTKVSGTTVVFSVNLTNAPSINAFQVYLSFNRSVIDVAQDTAGNFLIDTSGNVFAITGASVSTAAECVGYFTIAGTSNVCNGLTSHTIVLVQSILGATTGSITSGVLFQVTFNVVGQGATQLRLHNVDLELAGSSVPVSTSNGYFTNIDCPKGTGVFCIPPIVTFTTPSPTIIVGSTVVFNATESRATNAGASISAYSWDWGDTSIINLCWSGFPPFVTRSPITSHTYCDTGTFTVTLTVNDTYGITSTTQETISIVHPPPQPDFTIDTISSIHQFLIISGKTLAVDVQLMSLNSFSGIVNVSVSIAPLFPGSPPASNVTATFVKTSLKLTAGGSNSTALLLSAPKDSVRTFDTVTIIGIHDGTAHFVRFQLDVEPPQFILSCWASTPATVPFCVSPFNVQSGVDRSFPIFLTSLYGFSGHVQLSVLDVSGYKATLDKHSFDLKANQTVATVVTLSSTTISPVGQHEFRILGTSHIAPSTFIIVNFNLVIPPLPPDLHIQYPSSVSVVAGENVSFQLRITSLNGLSGSGLVLGVVLPNASQPWDSLRFPIDTTFTLSAGGSTVTTITFPTSSSTPAGKYTIAFQATVANAFDQTAIVTLDIQQVPH